MTAVESPTLGGEIVEREISGVGVLRFENLGPGEWLTQKGEPAKKARRRYLLDDGEMDSVSSIVSTLDKPALLHWYEEQSAIGAVRAHRAGELDGVPEDEYVERLKLLRLGASAARDEGADRGHAIHAAFERLAKHGEVPRPSVFPPGQRAWVQGAVSAWMHMRPEPVEVEQIVCNPEHGYAGRPDLIAIVDGRRTLIDWKTGKGRVFDQAHYQTRAYAECLPCCGLDPVDDIVIVGVDDQGGFELIRCEATPEDFYDLLRTFRSRKRVNAGMAKQRKALRAAAKEAASA